MTQELFRFDTDFGSHYDEFVRNFVPGYDSLFSMILALLQTELGAKAKLLVVGSGTGKEVLTFAPRMPRWTFTAVDPSPRMVEQCRAKLEQAKLVDRVDLRVGSVEVLPSGELYDAATLVLVLHFVPDNGAQYALLRGISQRLKQGGSLIIVHHTGDRQTEVFHHLLSAWTNYQILMGLAPEKANTLMEEALATHHFVSESRTIELLDSVGFQDIERFYTAFVTSGWLARKK
jgi:tRNA (cmo5U34)-methyltransferase